MLCILVSTRVSWVPVKIVRSVQIVMEFHSVCRVVTLYW